MFSMNSMTTTFAPSLANMLAYSRPEAPKGPETDSLDVKQLESETDGERETSKNQKIKQWREKS